MRLCEAMEGRNSSLDRLPLCSIMPQAAKREAAMLPGQGLSKDLAPKPSRILAARLQQGKLTQAWSRCEARSVRRSRQR